MRILSEIGKDPAVRKELAKGGKAYIGFGGDNAIHPEVVAPDLVDLALRVAVQEYGQPNPELIQGLEARGAAVTRVPVYRWSLPDDTGPLRRAIAEVAGGGIGAVLFTAAQQVVHLIEVARQDGREADLRAALATAEADATGGLSPRILPMGEIRDLGGLLGRAGLALPVADATPYDLSYPDPLALMRDLAAMGEGNALASRLRHPTRRDVLLGAAALYLILLLPLVALVGALARRTSHSR